MLPLPIAKTNPKAVRILTDDGKSIIDIETVAKACEC